MDGPGQAPAATAPLDASTPTTSTADHAPTTPALAAAPDAAVTVLAALPPSELTSATSDRPVRSNGPEDRATADAVNEAPAVQQQPKIAPSTNVAPLPAQTQTPAATPALDVPAASDNNAGKPAGEAEHPALLEEQAKVESAILHADAAHIEQSGPAAHQSISLTDMSLDQANAATSTSNADMLHSPHSPSSTSALSSVTASAAPSLANPTPSNQSVKDVKEDEESSESGQQHAANAKPRSTGGRSTARRAASNSSLRETATAASPTSSSRRSEKPPSTSAASGASASRTRGTSAQSQPQRQSSRSKTSTATTTISNTRPRMRQRGASPDSKDGLDTTPGTRRSRRTRQTTTQNGRMVGEEDDSGDGDEGITRCVCGNNDDETLAFMIQCDTCKAWQHGPCVGFKYENDCPDTYYCEQCRPDLHPNLLSRGKKHGRSFSASGRSLSSSAGGGTVNPKDEPEELGRSTSSNKPTQRDTRELSTTSLPATATATISSTHPSYHRARSSADAAMMSSFLDTSQQSPQPDSPGSPGGSSEGGSKRPMYPPTSHFAAPQNPKRRSTMNSRDSAAFDESILLATQQAFRESRAMATEGGLGSSKGRKRKKRDEDDMEPVKEEEEDHSDEENRLRQHSMGSKEPLDAQMNGAVEASASNPAAAANGEEAIGDEDADEQDDMSADVNGLPAPRKRRRRRGAGALFTAPNKKRAASARAKKPTNTETDEIASHEDSSVKGLQHDSSVVMVEEDANARKRKRDEANGDDERSGIAASPTAPRDTDASSQSSSDKPLAQANKRLKASPTVENVPEVTAAPPTETVSNILGSTLQVAIPTASGEDSAAAPSPATSVPPGQTDTEEISKDHENHVKPLTNGLLIATEVKGGIDTDQEESTPAPATQNEANAAANAVTNSKGIKQPNQYTYKRGGPGSRGGLKGSPSKRAALAAAAEARHGKHRDDTPSTYEDWINQPPSWGVPDHLSHLSHLLPSTSPLPLQVTKFITSPGNSAVASPITPQGEAGSSSAQNGETAPPTPAITVSNSLEPSAKIRFPSRRMSIAEMRKRAKNMLDYLARVRVETIDRSNRNRALAAVQENMLTNGVSLPEGTVVPPPSMLFNKDTPLTPQTTTLIDDLSRQLNSFQEKFL